LKLDRLRVFAGLNIALLLGALITAIAAALAADKCSGRDVFFIAPALNGSAYYFGADDLDELKAACQPARLAGVSLGSGTVSYGGLDVYSKLIYGGGACFALNNIRFRCGGPWAEGGASGQALVINDSLAWQLFGSLDALDKSVYVGGEIYSVAGVARQERVSKDGCCAYLPLDPLSGARDISGVFMQAAGYNKLGSYNTLNAWLEARYKDPRDYYIADINRYREGVALKYKLLLLGLGLYVIAALLLNSYRLIKHHYPRQAPSARRAALLCLLCLAEAALIIALLKGLSPTVWTPHVAGSRLSEVIRTVTNSGFLPAREYLLPNLRELVKLNAQANIALAVGAAALANFIFVHKARP
jgi:hypothetical protein